MSQIHSWGEVESNVYQPGIEAGAIVGIVFMLVGAVFGVVLWQHGILTMLVVPIMGGMTVCGAVVFGIAVRRIIWPIVIRHAGPNVLSEVPNEPVARDGALVQSCLMHELWEGPEAWQLRPKQQRAGPRDLLLLFCVGIPVIALVSWLVALNLREFWQVANWFTAALYGTLITVIGGGAVLFVIAKVMGAIRRGFATLTIPRDGGDLTIDIGSAPDFVDASLMEGLKWIRKLSKDADHLTIPRDLIAAVQLCPWKVTVVEPRSRNTMWTAQGLLVLASSEHECQRIPLLATLDVAGAAKLMQRLAAVLQVPYLFRADAAAWKAEAVRAKSRPAVRGMSV
jgi:hypothetical protein